METSPIEIEEQIACLLKELAIDEKLSLLAGKGFWKTRSIPRLSIPSMKLVAGPRGVEFHSAFRRAIAFPTGIAVGASWSPELAEEFSIALAR